MTNRVDGWQAALDAYLDRWHSVAFRPGVADCAIFASGAVKTITGRDMVAEWMGYETETEGRERLRAGGFDNMAEFLSTHLEQIPPVQSGLGDVVLLKNDALGIMGGARVFCVTARGLGTVPRVDALKAFKV